MERDILRTVIVTEVAVALAFPVAFGLAYGACGPPNLRCLQVGVGCVASCRDAWAQFPEILVYSATLALLPAAAGAGAGWLLKSRVCGGPRFRTSGRLLGPPLLSLLGSGVILAVFPLMSTLMVEWLFFLAAGMALLVGVVWFVIDRSARRLPAAR